MSLFDHCPPAIQAREHTRLDHLFDRQPEDVAALRGPREHPTQRFQYTPKQWAERIAYTQSQILKLR